MAKVPSAKYRLNPHESKTLDNKVPPGDTPKIAPATREKGDQRRMPALPATFNDFLGNSTAVEHLRTAIAAGRLFHSLILAGPSGAGKYTLALMLAMAVECERQP